MVRETWPKPIESHSEDFDKQFSENREKFKVTGGMAEVIDATPNTLKSETPVLLSSGWAATNEVSKVGLRNLFERGHRVLAIDHPRIGGNMDNVSKELLEQYPKAQLRKALNIIDVLNQKGLEQVDAVAHSEGAVNVAIAAALNPEKFRNIVFFAPAGLIGGETLLELLKKIHIDIQSGRPESFSGKQGFPEIPFTDAEIEIGEIAVKEMKKYFLKNPVRGIKELVDMSKSQIHNLLRYIHEQGIGIAILALADDNLFSIENISKTIGPLDKESREKGLGGVIDGFASVVGRHGEIGTHPEWYIEAVDDMLDALERKKGKLDNDN